jgi:ParB/RepB/Spo0J family partition protein
MLVRYERVDKRAVKAGKQVRTIETDASLHGLAESMVKEGQLQPIGLLADFSLIWGFRRHAAAMLRQEITHLWAAIFDQAVTEQQFLLMRATENFHRLELTPWERYQTAEELLRLNPSWKSVDLAAHLHLDAGTITRLLSPGRCIPAVQDALKSGAVGISDCYAISRASTEHEQHELLAAKLNGASQDEVQRQVRMARNGNGKPAVKVSRVKCAMPSGVIVTLTGEGEGMTLADVIETLSELLKEARRANDQGLDSKTFSAVMRDKSKAG